MCGLHPWLCIYLWQTRIVQVWVVCQLKVEGAGKKEIHRASSWETMEDLCDVKVIDTPGIKFWLRHFTALSKFSNVSKPSFKTPSHSVFLSCSFSLSIYLYLSLYLFLALALFLSISVVSASVALIGFADFPWCNNSTTTDFRLLPWSQWMWIWDKMCPNGSRELVSAGSRMLLGVNYSI